ncbi:MAG: hypothetical protein FWD78_16615, partial [Treponema sp.]|nr:hypothetical protein [Treponema sp.]
WTASEQIKNVQLLISSTTNPAADLKAQVVDANAGSGAVYLPPLESGRWYWIIRADTLDKKGATSGEIFWFNVDPIPQLPAIQTIQPEDNSVIGIEQLTRDRSIMFRWEPVEGANAYIFNLYKDGTPPQKIADPDPMEARTYVFNNLTLLSEGDYYWQVEAISRNDNGIAEQRGITELHPFKIQIQRSTGLQTQSQGTLYGQ